MNSEIASSIPKEEALQAVERRPWRALAIQLLGPITIVVGLAWAVAQPYRIVFLERADRGVYDYLFQAPLLVILVGLVYTFGIAPGLIEDLEAEESRDPAG